MTLVITVTNAHNTSVSQLQDLKYNSTSVQLSYNSSYT